MSGLPESQGLFKKKTSGNKNVNRTQGNLDKKGHDYKLCLLGTKDRWIYGNMVLFSQIKWKSNENNNFYT